MNREDSKGKTNAGGNDGSTVFTQKKKGKAGIYAPSLCLVRNFTTTLFYVALAKRFVVTNAPEMRCYSKVLRYSIVLTTMVEHCALCFTLNVYLHTLA